MFLSFFQVMLLALFLAWNVFLEYLDWHGRVEVLKDKHPKVYRVVHNRPMRLTLLLLCLAYLAKDFRDSVSVAAPPVLSVKTPPPPAVQIGTMPEQERQDSLRRRTMRLADEFAAYLAKAQENKPPDAFPNSSDPNPSEERKKAIEQSRAYYRTIEDYYFRHFSDHFVGIIREYNSKGVRSGNFEIDFDNRVPSVAEQGSFFESFDDLSRFRDLTYHVDAEDHLTTF